jgi:hypothetical protein
MGEREADKKICSLAPSQVLSPTEDLALVLRSGSKLAPVPRFRFLRSTFKQEIRGAAGGD